MENESSQKWEQNDRTRTSSFYDLPWTTEYKYLAINICQQQKKLKTKVRFLLMKEYNIVYNLPKGNKPEFYKASGSNYQENTEEEKRV